MNIAFLKRLITGVAVIGILVCGTTASSEDKFPSRNIEYVVGWGAGGGSDIFGRIINMPVRRQLNTTISVVNMPGAASAISMEYVQKQPADGYTLLGLTSELVSNHMQNRTKFTHRDFAPVMRAHVDIGMLQGSPKSPFKNWQELIAFAKKGERKIRLGGTGAASFDQIASMIILESAGIADKITYIPFDSAGEMHAQIMGGHLDAMYEEPGVTLKMIEAGQMIPLIVFTKERLKKLPEVPSAGELGYDIPPMMWRGVVAKKGTPDNVIAVLEQAYTKAMESSMYKAFEKESLLDLFPGYMNSKQFAADLDREYELYKKIIEKLGK
ncbi:MAG: tripartite tricarboxylate transporter substrate binding protein [Desulfobacteraceae bacterium]|nr:MAG: tripartite tricarboxylate transporter substrate binding protein [Desulfobacteraceae bacterium]